MITLADILTSHAAWLAGDPTGQPAQLRGVDFHGIGLTRAQLQGADFGGADLRLADMEGANLRTADLRLANVESAQLYRRFRRHTRHRARRVLEL